MDFNVYCRFFFAFISEKTINELKGGSFELLRGIWISLNCPGSVQGSHWYFTSGFGLQQLTKKPKVCVAPLLGVSGLF